MGTLKCHMLDHVVEDLMRMGSLVYNDAGLYEYADITSKRLYKLTSTRRRSAMRETIHRIGAHARQSNPNIRKGMKKERFGC